MPAEYIKPINKPSNYYYSDLLYSKLINNEPYILKVFDMNTYTYYDVNEEEPDILLGFFKSLNSANYSKDFDLNGLKAKYKLHVNFKDYKFVMNIVDEKIVTVYPWDGVYREDVICAEGISDYFNLYKFCEYIEKSSR